MDAALLLAFSLEPDDLLSLDVELELDSPEPEFPEFDDAPLPEALSFFPASRLSVR